MPVNTNEARAWANSQLVLGDGSLQVRQRPAPPQKSAPMTMSQLKTAIFEYERLARRLRALQCPEKCEGWGLTLAVSLDGDDIDIDVPKEMRDAILAAEVARLQSELARYADRLGIAS
jgi:hypothetical protein